MTDQTGNSHAQPEAQIDWQTIWEQLDWDDEGRQQRALEERLRQRAVQYAATKDTEVLASTATLNLLTFDLGAERYGIDVMAVRGVRTVNVITRVPGTPAFYRGVVNIRGQIITVLDLRLFFNLDMEETKPPRELVIVRGNGLELGVLAHHIAEVTAVSRSSIEPVEISYASGVTPDKLVVLDVEQLLTDERLIIGGVED